MHTKNPQIYKLTNNKINHFSIIKIYFWKLSHDQISFQGMHNLPFIDVKGCSMTRLKGCIWNGVSLYSWPNISMTGKTVIPENTETQYKLMWQFVCSQQTVATSWVVLTTTFSLAAIHTRPPDSDNHGPPWCDTCWNDCSQTKIYTTPVDYRRSETIFMSLHEALHQTASAFYST